MTIDYLNLLVINHPRDYGWREMPGVNLMDRVKILTRISNPVKPRGSSRGGVAYQAIEKRIKQIPNLLI